MAFNNYYGNYNPYAAPMGANYNGAMQDNLSQLRGMQTPTAPNMSGAVWVQGENAAKSYPVAPNNNVILMDSEASRFYIKTVDPSGMPLPLRVFEYKEVGVPDAPVTVSAPDMSQFVTRDELTEILKQFSPTEKKTSKSNKEASDNV